MATRERGSVPLLERRETLWFIIGLIALLFAFTNFPWQLDDYDQAKQAFTSFEMVNEGHWFYQHTPNQKIATKPPLVGWISAGLYGVTRSWELAWRVPSLAAAAVLLVVVFRAARDAYGYAAGVIALAACGLNLLSPRLASLVRTDMPLALLVFLLGLKVWQHVRTAQPWQFRDQLLMFALLTAAMMVKGPIVYAFLLPGIVVFALTRRGTSGARYVWCGWWPWVASLAIFLGWAAAGIAWVPQFYEEVVLKEFAGRFGETAHRPQPLLFYFPHLLHKFAPWSVLAIALVVIAWRAKQTSFAKRWRDTSPDVAWLICWSLGGMILMSLIPSKRVDRIFPIVPPLCLLLAAQFSGLATAAKLLPRLRLWAPAAVIFACVWTTAYASHKVIVGYRDDRGALARFGREFRHEAAARNWRYEVVGKKEEGMLLYLHRTRFLKPADAIERWNAGAVEALIIPAEQAEQVRTQLQPAAASVRRVAAKVDKRPRTYVLLMRQAEPR